MNTLTTNSITITVESRYLPGLSAPRMSRFIFGYYITIFNGSDQTVQLMRRHWLIFDANGVIREVEGEGVVGMQPILNPGESHQYASYCDLNTDMGKMKGRYQMRSHDEGKLFYIPVPEFRMCTPFKLN
ncbi:MAG: Co2+/Mg2+ efflux protein ApaG [Bacteroidota bacterium]